MKRISVFLLVLCFVLICGCESEPESSDVVSLSSAYNITVYLTKTGECYHEDDCTCLSKSKIKKALSEVYEDYRPCQVCYPPVIEE